MVVAAPFDTPGRGRGEELVRRYALHRARAPISPSSRSIRLNGLPDLEAAIAAMVAGGAEVATSGPATCRTGSP